MNSILKNRAATKPANKSRHSDALKCAGALWRWQKKSDEGGFVATMAQAIQGIVGRAGRRLSSEDIKREVEAAYPGKWKIPLLNQNIDLYMKNPIYKFEI